ncbi:hypothetical protein E6P09_18910 (plasmid) [Haloferax mediterranei ATCC 33500]|uniref:Uncharacterized protein n=1 Tax=Haloferax mediterranei (strain ATCC 33500 / DSM 1411 / JCM 8866 / NBRC 14739 / NCIMB 2177 / R-4) TaxID=523841 RepID=I3R8Z6_HALMT|nr:hypothetical protein HFX_4011 [Haloferax mediterranei ATCC 33500]AHZ24037.1 hypothetical protein BM92_19745 [Haloferax mediterranei ATCC 33500]ELZ97623.1 hypothetical protein C439_16943 [Haloferax mediterranei ATCC 33500]QCQ77391.1 hypothetical protein E6P09_18910 [Haloferax mediterranei ATCC 33500]
MGKSAFSDRARSGNVAGLHDETVERHVDDPALEMHEGKPPVISSGTARCGPRTDATNSEPERTTETRSNRGR